MLTAFVVSLMSDEMSANIFGLLLINVLCLLHNALIGKAFDCTNFSNLKEPSACCNITEPNWNGLYTSCEQEEDGLQRRAPSSPCLLDCIFTTSRALEADSLQVFPLRLLLANALNSNMDLVQMYMRGYVDCDLIMHQYRQETKTSRPANTDTLDLKKCSRFAYSLTKCAIKQVNLNCSGDFWIMAPDCEYTRQYYNECDNRSNSGHKTLRGHLSGRRGRSVDNVRNAIK